MKFNLFGRALALCVILAVPVLSGCETQPAFQVSQPSSRVGTVESIRSQTVQNPNTAVCTIGGALVGTFLGILVSYGFVAPVAGQLEQKCEEEGKIYQVIKAVLLASMNGYAPQVAVEFGRKVLYSGDRPTFLELEEDLKARKGK